MALPHISSLHVYPVKSARGIAVTEAMLDAFGLAGDRRFMLVDAATGRFVSQREVPILALVRVALAHDQLWCEVAGQPAFSVPVSGHGGPRLDVTLWDWDGPSVGVDQGDEAAAWWSRALGRDVRFVRSPDDTPRLTQPTPTGLQGRVAFSDGFPLLVVSTTSLDALNAQLAEPVPMDRFRPNIVVDGVSTAHDEDAWADFTIGGVAFRGTKRCPRCVMTTIDQQTGTAGPEPLRTLSAYRRSDGKVWFGLNAEHAGAGTLRIGDQVQVQQRFPAGHP